MNNLRFKWSIQINSHTKTALFIATTHRIYRVNHKKLFMTTTPPPPKNKNNNNQNF